ncbi:hypothetical protein MU582_21360 [Nocardioidaceae bacterium SCSIO 66511]|nr:hypothetical protein MU582_21360 [Nocardioidaceae bacterium SCSIO 66511]
MRRAGLAVAAAIMAAGTLTACGGGDDFCDAGGDLDSFDPESSETKDAIDDAVDAAPDEIKDDMELLRDVVNDPESVSEMDPEEVSSASTNITEYVDENCD